MTHALMKIAPRPLPSYRHQLMLFWQGCWLALLAGISLILMGNGVRATVQIPVASDSTTGVRGKLAPVTPAQPLNPSIKVGIKQRFGQKMADKLTIEALPGDQLTLQFTTGKQLQTLTTDKVEFAITSTPFPKPQRQERVVLSIHRSYETAETKANEFKALGIPVEIAQPQQWQVWAKRDRYPTSKDRLRLLNALKQQGLSSAFLHQRSLKQKPQLSFVAGGYRYQRSIVSITSKKQQFQIGKERHSGLLRFQPNVYGTYTLVNRVPTETYLRGVVPYEIGFNAPTTAIEAQAIIARTYALRNLRRFQIDDYELCADTQCQVYKGIDQTDPVVDQAIQATQGQVLTHKNELVDALYSSTTGGVTAAFQEVWEGTSRPYLTAKIDALPQGLWDLRSRSLAKESNLRAFIGLKDGFNEATWPKTFRWQKETQIAQLNNHLRGYLRQAKHPFASFKSIRKLEVAERSQGGRVQQLNVTTNLGVVKLKKDDILRGFEAPNSLLFYVEPRYAKTKPKPAVSPTPKPAEPLENSKPNLAAQPSVPSTPSVAPSSSASGLNRATTKATPVPTKSRSANNPAAIAPKTQKVLKGYAFIGGGFGHGVGLSQTGSYHLSKLGWSAEQILSFYYPGTRLQPLNDSVVFWRPPSISVIPITIPGLSDQESHLSPEQYWRTRLFSHQTPKIQSWQWLLDWFPLS